MGDQEHDFSGFCSTCRGSRRSRRPGSADADCRDVSTDVDSEERDIVEDLSAPEPNLNGFGLFKSVIGGWQNSVFPSDNDRTDIGKLRWGLSNHYKRDGRSRSVDYLVRRQLCGNRRTEGKKYGHARRRHTDTIQVFGSLAATSRFAIGLGKRTTSRIKHYFT